MNREGGLFGRGVDLVLTGRLALLPDLCAAFREALDEAGAVTAFSEVDIQEAAAISIKTDLQVALRVEVGRIRLDGKEAYSAEFSAWVYDNRGRALGEAFSDKSDYDQIEETPEETFLNIARDVLCRVEEALFAA